MFELPAANPGAPDLRSAWRFLVWVARQQSRVIVGGAVFGILWMTSLAATPLALGAALGAIVGRDRAAIYLWACVLLAIGLLQAVAGIMRHWRAVANFLHSASRIEQLVSRHACYLGAELSSRVAAGEVASLGATDVERIGDALDVSARTSGSIVSFLAVSIVLLLLSPALGAIVVLGVPLSMALIVPVIRPIERRQTAERERRSEASSLAADTVHGLRVLRGLGGERVFAQRFERAANEVAEAAVRTAILQSYLDAAQVLLPGALVVAITWVGAHFAVRGAISPGELVAFYASAAFLLIPMQTFVEASSKFTAALVASRRVIAVLSLEREIGEPPAGEERPYVSGGLYDELTGTRIEAGLLTAVVPATPEEGSALIDRLGRFSESEKMVTIGGTPVNRLGLATLRRQVVVLERSPVQLATRLAEVVAAAGTRASEVVEAAGATEIVDGLPRGVDTELPERWRTLSGGQRQRLALAQALAGDPDVLLLDDPTSAVDAHTEAAIADRLKKIREGRTTVITTTSPLLLDRADTVVLLDGTAVAVGTHEYLLANEPRYLAVVLRGEA